MKIFIGKKGLNATFQKPFPETTECCQCDGESRIGFVAFEDSETTKQCIASLHPNEQGNMWLHGACAVAVYFCRECLGTTALYNQG